MPEGRVGYESNQLNPTDLGTLDAIHWQRTSLQAQLSAVSWLTRNINGSGMMEKWWCYQTTNNAGVLDLGCLCVCVCIYIYIYFYTVWIIITSIIAKHCKTIFGDTWVCPEIADISLKFDGLRWLKSENGIWTFKPFDLWVPHLPGMASFEAPEWLSQN